MPDYALLIVVLSLLYISECLAWVPWGAAAVRVQWRSHGEARLPGTFLHRLRGGLVSADLWLPPGDVFLCGTWPFSITPQAISTRSAQTLGPREALGKPAQLIPLSADLKLSREGRALSIGGVTVQCASPTAARELLAIVKRVRELPVGERQQAIDAALKQSLDVGAIGERVQTYRAGTSVIRVLATLTVLHLFIAFPVAMAKVGLGYTWPHLLGVYGALLLGLLITYYRAHRRLYPDEGGDRWMHLFIMLLSPAAAMRAVDSLGKPLMAAKHPVAVMLAVGDADGAQNFIRATLADLDHPLPSRAQADAGVVEIEEAFRPRLRAHIKAASVAAGHDPAALLAPPADGGNVFCPRCFAAFDTDEGGCPDCDGMSLQPRQ